MPITSHKELELWLKDKPADWAQVIATRAVLRMMPYAFAEQVPQEWVNDFALGLIRAISISWAASNFPAHDMADAAAYASAAAYAAADAAYAVDAARAAYAAADTAYAARAADAAADAAVWPNINHDCDWLAAETNQASAARILTRKTLWPAGVPDGWDKARAFADARLAALGEGYGVWIDWYDRRVRGKRAAFAIPGDKNRTKDKKILTRLADATDEDFWGKGATFVNTTLQSWIDEARDDARIEEILRKLRGGALPHYGSPNDLARRATLLNELDRLLGKSPQTRHGIGGNYPPEPIDAGEQTAQLPQEMHAPLETISTELEKREPDALVVVEQVKLLRRVARRLGKMAGVAGDKFAESFADEMGKGAAKLITRVSYLIITTPIVQSLLDWLTLIIK